MQRMPRILHFAAVSEDKGVIQFIQTRTRTSSPRTTMLSKVSKRKRALRGHYGRGVCEDLREPPSRQHHEGYRLVAQSGKEV